MFNKYRKCVLAFKRTLVLSPFLDLKTKKDAKDVAIKWQEYNFFYGMLIFVENLIKK